MESIIPKTQLCSPRLVGEGLGERLDSHLSRFAQKAGDNNLSACIVYFVYLLSSDETISQKCFYSLCRWASLF